MSTGILLSLLVNILVGIYLAWFYPRSVRKTFPDGNLPRIFAILTRVMPIVGIVLIIGSVLYGILSIGGAFGS
jgi:uncharacterized protein (DUF3820 family)